MMATTRRPAKHSGVDKPASESPTGEAPGANAELRYLAAFAGLVTTLTGRFVNLAPATLDEEITRALRQIGEFATVDRSYVFQFSEDGSRVSTTHEWCAPGIEPAIDRIQDVPVEAFQWAMSRLMQKEVLYIEAVEQLPPDAAAVKTELQRQGVQSLINLPLVCGGRVLGFLGFDSVRHVQTWTAEHIKLLKVVGEIIAGTIERHRTNEALQRRAAMETLVAEISTRFINVRTDNLDAEVNRAITAIGRFADVDRSYVFRFSADDRTMSNTHEWCADGIEPHMLRLQNLALEAFAYSLTIMRQGAIFYVPDVEQLPANAAAEKAEFEAEHIKTLINVPIMRRGEMTGFLGLDAVRQHKVWSEADIQLLKLIGEIFASAMDRIATERKLETSLKEKEVLLREIHHRVKNNMQIVASLLYLQAHASHQQLGNAATEAFTKSQHRIKAMAAIHDRLYRSGNLSSIDFCEYLRALVPDLVRSYQASDRVAASIDADRLFLPIDQAIPCGLIVNELLTNCLKHAFPGRRGNIRITLRVLPDGRRQLSVADDGVGLGDTDGAGSGSMGLGLVQDLAYQLDGHVETTSNAGTRVDVYFGEAG
jgi:two-component sensor histidine kinase/putative methionine-R-sulfoxide reductase with GAF domain